MAIVKGPALSLEASGNLGAICYSRWRDRQVARGTWTGTVISTPAQIVIQSFLAAAAQEWGQVLTFSDRAAWNEYARSLSWTTRLGDRYAPSGYNVFISYSVQRQRWGLAIATEPPAAHKGEMPEYFNVWSDAAGNLHTDLHYDWWDTKSDGVEYWIAGPYNSPGRRAREPEYRFKIAQLVPSFSEAEWAQSPIDKWYWVKSRFLWLPGYTGNYWERQHYHTIGA